MSEERMRARASQEALHWFVASREGLDAVEQAVLDEWLKVPANAGEYMELEQLAHELREAADPELDVAALLESARADEDDDEPRVRAIGEGIRRAPRPPARVSWLYAAAAAAAAFVVLPLLWMGAHRASPLPEQVTLAHFETRHGERMTQRLADGSVLSLNTDSAVTIRYSRAGRLVEMQRGQVIFEVVHDANRPFRVIAGAAEVVDVGTTFDVYLRAESTLVTVVEGRVVVGLAPRSSDGSHPGQLSTGESGQVRTHATRDVVAGQQLRVAEGQLPASASPVDTELETAWQRGQLVFEQQSLGEVVAQFNRYAATPIEIESPALAQRRISGAVATNDTESFVAFLRSLEGVRVEVTPNRIRVSKHM